MASGCVLRQAVARRLCPCMWRFGRVLVVVGREMDKVKDAIPTSTDVEGTH